LTVADDLVARFGHEPHPLEDFSFEVEDATLSLKYFKISSDFKEPTETDKDSYWPEPFFRITLNTPCSVMLYSNRQHASEYYSILRNREKDLEDRIEAWEKNRRFSLDQIAVRRAELEKIFAQEQANLDNFVAAATSDATANRRKQELESNIREHEAVLAKPRPSLRDDSGVEFMAALRFNSGPSIQIHKMIEFYKANRKWWIDGFGVVPRKKWKHVVKDGSHATGVVVVIDYHG